MHNDFSNLRGMCTPTACLRAYSRLIGARSWRDSKRWNFASAPDARAIEKAATAIPDSFHPARPFEVVQIDHLINLAFGLPGPRQMQLV